MIPKEWSVFKRYVSDLPDSTRMKGKYFECFCYYLLMQYPLYNYDIDKVWFYEEFPEKLKDELKLPLKDKGTDLVIKKKKEYSVHDKRQYVVVQCKFLSDETKRYTRKMLSTFCEDVTPVGEGLYISTQNNPTDFENTDRLEGIRVINQICLRDIEAIQAKEPELMESIILNTWKHVHKEEVVVSKYNMSRMEERPYQKECITKGVEHFKENNKGVLWAAGGCGKTFMAISLYKALTANVEKSRVMIVMPSLFLVGQTMEYFLQTDDAQKENFIINFCSIREKNGNNLKCTTDVEELKVFLGNYSETNKNLVVLVTYASVEKCVTFFHAENYRSDAFIFDEAHTLVSDNRKLSDWFYDNCNSFYTDKQMFLSATPKSLDVLNNKKAVTMSNEEQFGKVFFKYQMRKAINEKYLSDYRVFVPVSSTMDIQHMHLFLAEIYDEDDDIKTPTPIFWRLMVSAFAIKDAFYRGKCKCMAICNTIKDMKLLNKLIGFVMNLSEKEVFTACIDGNIKPNIRRKTIQEFENTTKKAVLTSVRTLTTGADIPCVDTVCITSPLRSESLIIQIICRGIRLYKNKVLDILIPILREEKSFDTMKRIVLALDGEDEIFINESMADNKRFKLKALNIQGGKEHIEWLQKHPKIVNDEDITFFNKEQLQAWKMEMLTIQDIHREHLEQTRAVIKYMNEHGVVPSKRNPTFKTYTGALKELYKNTKDNKEGGFITERMQEAKELEQCIVWTTWYEQSRLKTKTTKTSTEAYLEKTKSLIDYINTNNQMPPQGHKQYIYCKTVKSMYRASEKKIDGCFTEDRKQEYELLKQCPFWVKSTSNTKLTRKELLNKTIRLIQLINQENRIPTDVKEFTSHISNLKTYYIEYKESENPKAHRKKEIEELDKCERWVYWYEIERVVVLTPDELYEKTVTTIELVEKKGRLFYVSENEWGKHIDQLKGMYKNSKEDAGGKKFPPEREREIAELEKCKIWMDWYNKSKSKPKT